MKIKNERIKYCYTGKIMQVAYDTFLQSKVFATQNCLDEPYRYVCTYCGEEVFIAAKDSNSMVAHFRHRSGNNDVDCDKYLGKFGSVSVKSESQKSDREKVEFYFNNTTKCFTIGIRFSENEILEYEGKNAVLEISIRRDAKPFFSQKINSANFPTDDAKLVVLETFSPVYFISNSFSHNKKPYMIFREKEPSFFKIKGKEQEFNAKLVRSDALYTGVRYFVALAGSNRVQLKLRKLSGIYIEQEFDFMFIEKHIWASVIMIKNKTTEIDDALAQWNYTLDTSEAIMLLWPPSYEIDDINFICANEAFLSSSFQLQPCRNINTDFDSIQAIDSNITKVTVDKHIKISRKGAEIEINARNSNLLLKQNNVGEQFVEKFTVPKENRYYLFSDSGVRELTYGENVVLTGNSYICEYSNGCLIRIIKTVEDSELKGEELFIDIIKHYKVFEPYKGICADGKPDFIVNYINSCKKTGIINSLVKKYIEESKL
ncbi:MAG: hypothetical protein NC225_05075 [Clostridium sp.]|nr:hypothetical protein [Clostridium sp.]MCM1398838.1 hypothetical protein [Clostridium sp.]MCM1458531.1 hypothetical protein [Bacteroides sp.]